MNSIYRTFLVREINPPPFAESVNSMLCSQIPLLGKIRNKSNLGHRILSHFLSSIVVAAVAVVAIEVVVVVVVVVGKSECFDYGP